MVDLVQIGPQVQIWIIIGFMLVLSWIKFRVHPNFCLINLNEPDLWVRLGSQGSKSDHVWFGWSGWSGPNFCFLGYSIVSTDDFYWTTSTDYKTSLNRVIISSEMIVQKKIIPNEYLTTFYFWHKSRNRRVQFGHCLSKWWIYLHNQSRHQQQIHHNPRSQRAWIRLQRFLIGKHQKGMLDLTCSCRLLLECPKPEKPGKNLNPKIQVRDGLGFT